MKELIFYDVKAASKMLSCSIYTARQIMQRADFPRLDVGKSMRVSKEAFEKWAMEKRT